MTAGAPASATQSAPEAPRALVVEPGHTRGALAAVRALAAAGWRVGVASPRRGPAAVSRHTRRWHRTSPPGAGLDGFVSDLGRALTDGGYQVLLPAADAELLALSLARDRLAAVVPCAAHDRVLRMVDKLRLCEAAHDAGLQTPRTVEATKGQIARWDPPFLVKASLHAPLPATGGSARLEAQIARSRAQAAQRTAQLRELGATPMLQELVQGRLVAHSFVSDGDGSVIASVHQSADGLWPPDLGVSARARVAAADPAISEGVATLARDNGWLGLAQAQFVVGADGVARLIDFNGRFYGSLALALAAGRNLPAIWASVALDGTAGPPDRQSATRSPARYQWLEGDLRRAARERRGGLTRDLLGCLAYSRGAAHAVWRADDPAPSLQSAIAAPGRLLRRARSRAAGGAAA